jgi:hypothetical protein
MKFYGFLWSPFRDITGQQLEKMTTTHFLLLSPAILPADTWNGTSARLKAIANELQTERRKSVKAILTTRKKTRRQKERRDNPKLNQTEV